ncbi:MAG: bifunctional DNA-formamidopyrimidine glycosylase/DNA-(apurinic or apyrimidinic site) lyase [Gammaproteobacteria bacterium]|nr:bifunctional DNA-formamidopyrimidine glycosylase/DNA-(apurinic or apyrimidinic site) lyase [Gammaproteobacteria bacterium]
MPELPEVETISRGIAPLVTGKCIVGAIVRDPRLRWPVEIPESVFGQQIVSVYRRAKYLLLRLETGSLIVHFGMSGSLRIVPEATAPGKHDHVDLELDDGQIVRLNDPRRFGSLHWHEGAPETHWLLAKLGIEPLAAGFTGAYLKGLARGRRLAVKSFIMDGRIVVGIGNIYANEVLFHAGIRPSVRAGRVTAAGYDSLVHFVRKVLQEAILMGGTTLRDFVNQDGRPGYFKQSLYVYGRANLPCRRCATPIKVLKSTQRATYFCPKCQRTQGFSRDKW